MFYRLFRCLSTAMALIPLLGSMAACAATVINVRDYGAKGDGVTDDTVAVNAAVAAGAKAGSGARVFFPPGKYLILRPRDGAHVHVNNANGLTLSGADGSAILADDPSASIIDVHNSTNTTIRNLTIEQDRYYFTQGTCLSMDPATHTIQLKLDPGYPPLDDKHLIVFSYWAMRVCDTATSGRYIWPSFTRRPIAIKHLDGSTWEMTFKNFLGDPPGKSDMNIVGKKVLVWDDHLGSHGISASQAHGLTVDNVKYYGKGVNAGLLFGSCDGTILIHKYFIGTPPGTNGLLSCSGGGQEGDIRGTLIYDHCDFERFDDDGADILTGLNRVLEQRDPRTLLVQGSPDFRVGDQVGIVNWLNKQERIRTHVAAVEQQPGGLLVHLADAVSVGKMGPGPDHPDLYAAAKDGIDRMTDYNLVTASTTFKDCTFQCNRARALNLKSQNTIVENCTFYNCEMSAVNAGPEMIWGEGPFVNNLTIRHNKFYRCDNPNVSVGLYYEANGSPSRDNHNILIEGNRFDQFGGDGAISINNATKVIIRNNWFGQPEVPLAGHANVINVSQCESVTVTGNTGTSASCRIDLF